MTKFTSRWVAGLAVTTVLAAVVQADPMAYVESGDAGWGTLDLSTGAYTNLGNSGVLLSGMGYYNGGYYGGAEGSSNFYSVNASNGTLTLIGNSGIEFRETGTTTAGVFGLGDNGDLYQINVTTGAATDLGATGLAIGGTIGFSSSGSTLYYASTESGTSDLYTLNTTTGAATLIGATNGANAVGAMLDLNGTLYGGADGTVPYSLWTLNTSTGSGTTDIGNTPLDGSDYWGLAAPPTAAPEPFTLGLGAAGIGLALRRRKLARSK